jgi:hypothetical protein
MDSPQVGELWRVFKSHYLAELELSAVLRAGTLGIVITDGFCQGGGRLVEMVCMNNGLPQVIEVGPASMTYWERVEEEDE